MSTPFPIDDPASIIVLRQHLRELSRGLPTEVVERAAIVMSELGHNQLRYGRLGEISVCRVADLGLDILATDTGRGLTDPVTAFGGAGASDVGLGIGLAGVRRACAALSVDSRVDQGLRIHAGLRIPGAPRLREWVLLGRPHPDEHVSGDDAVVIDRGGGCWTAVMADGLGHGPDARRAAVAATRTARAHAHEDPIRILERCDEALLGTRGAAVAVASLEGDDVCVAIGGNIRVSVVNRTEATRILPVPKVVGKRAGRRFRSTTVCMADATLVMATDGIHESGLPRSQPSQAWPLALAADLMGRHGRDRDDVTVLALR